MKVYYHNRKFHERLKFNLNLAAKLCGAQLHFPNTPFGKVQPGRYPRYGPNTKHPSTATVTHM